ncbi:SWITCH/sucrose nonfermenting 3A [Wolffia australiana]
MEVQRTSEVLTSAPHDRELYTIPSRSRWFHWDEIHDTEKRELSEFFDGSSASRNPRVYKEYRDFIINKYREDAGRRITLTEIRRSLVGDVGSIHRVFLFLDRWGLINFSVADGGGAVEDSLGAVTVAVEDGPPIAVKVVACPGSAKGFSAPAGVPPSVVDSRSGFRLPPLTSYSDVFSDCTPIAGRICGDCGDECFSGYYESKSGMVVCVKCFESGEANSRKAAEDFDYHNEKDENAGNLNSPWTERETLSLLEAIVSKGPDWDLVANHVRRSRLDCIGKLIQLPFGEHMASKSGKFDKIAPLTQREEESSDEVDEEIIDKPTRKRKFLPSLADVGNSLLEQAASLSARAGPDVASAAAGAAILALCEENSFAKKVFGSDGEEKNNPSRSLPSEGSPVSDVKAEPYDEEMDFGRSIIQIRASAATALAATAAHAKLLADQEQRQIDYLMASVIDLQMKKMRHKMKHFGELESIMEQQYVQIQQLKEDIIHEWIDISQRPLAAGIPRWKDPGLTKPPVPARSTIA